MAKDFIDDSDVLALGVTPEQMMGKGKVETVSSIKSIGEQQGKPVTSEEISKTLQALANTIVSRVSQISLSTTKSFLPINSQLQQINDLLLSRKEDDQERAFGLIDRLQSRLGIDLSKYSKEIGSAVQKLYDMNRMRKEDKAEAQRIHTEKVDELKKEREILRERGINTYINEKNYKLEIRTKEQEKQELNEIRKEEKLLKEREKELQRELKDIKKIETRNLDREERFLAEQENLTKDQLKLQERKEKANIQPGQGMPRGFLSDTFGAAIEQVKSFGGELKFIGKSIVGAFKNIPSTIAGLGRSLGAGALAVGKFALGLGKGLLIGAVIGIIIYALYRLYRGIVDVVNKVKSFFGFGDKKKEEGLPSTDENQNKMLQQDTTQTGETQIKSVKGGEAEKFLDTKGQVKDLSKEEFDGLSPEDKNLYVQTKGAEKSGLLPKPAIQPIPKDINVNKMSTELAAAKEEITKPSTNVVAPTSQIVTNNNTTQSVVMSPNNIDRSFINLNTIPI